MIASGATSLGSREAQSLPEHPLVSIRPSGKWSALNLRDLWSYRELLYFLTWRDVKVRYKQTLLGATWAIIQPLFAMLIFTLFFGRLAGVPSDGIPYPLFAFAGLLPWMFFSNAVTASGNSLVGSSHLITKVYFPRIIIPAAAVVAGLVDFGIAFVILAGLMAYYRVPLVWTMWMLPVLVSLTVLIALGVGMLTSALNVKYRDVRHALPFAIQLWMFVTPIIYPASIVPARWRWALAINPLAGIIESYRSSLFGRQLNWPAITISTAITFVVLAGSAYIFRCMEKNFADIV
ncbi:MAG TPA: ABC transporter permease [Blastocatellia bacterium]|nr:ABC transporter permease [Blastocatellia bacterium]